VSKGLQIAIGAALIAALLGWYGWSALGGEAGYRYYQTLDELEAARATGPARVHGYVAAGSIERDLASRSVRFQMQQAPTHGAEGRGAPRSLPVRYASLETPDLFKDGAEVVVEGELAAEGGAPVFHATKVLAKCPSKFRPEATEPASF
jgi:cytochrome c-type biogenesis protein CcmE